MIQNTTIQGSQNDYDNDKKSNQNTEAIPSDEVAEPTADNDTNNTTIQGSQMIMIMTKVTKTPKQFLVMR